jgi:hypothetical protein
MSINQGPAGASGGAVYLAASTLTFTSNAVINASGAAGGRSGFQSGGNGGGSGGMIVVYIRTTLNVGSGAILVANGGNGASGGDAADNGTVALDPDPRNPTMAQPAAIASGGNSGNGGTAFPADRKASPAVNANCDTCGGGGGGGERGVIVTNYDLGATITSPTAVPFP